MFEAGVPVGADPALREASERAFAVLRGAADKVCATMPTAGRPPALMVALHIWTVAHGLASLFGRGDGAQRAMPMSAAELLEAQCSSIYAGSEQCGAPVRPTPGRRRAGGPNWNLTTAVLDVNVHYIHKEDAPWLSF